MKSGLGSSPSGHSWDRSSTSRSSYGLFNRHTPETVAYTASSDLVLVPKSGTVTAKTLTLNLNGTSFQGLRQSTTDLVSGTYYTVSGDQLTLTAAALTKMVGSRDYGVNVTLQARFSAGMPWRINVITSATPTLSAATGTTSSFAIPTQFNGDQLATMEAKYADGSGAGPHNWTTYKEFETAFSPDCTASTITLQPALFSGINDSAKVALVFHFWSGATVIYYVTESGSLVTGTLS